MVDVGETRRRRGEIDVLPRAEAEETATHEAVAEQSKGPVLQGVAEVDQHVPAEDEMCLAEYFVGHQVMVEEGDVAAQSLVDLDEVVARAVVVAEGMLSTGLEVIARPVAGVARGIDAFARGGERRIVEIGGIDVRAVV